MKKNNNSLLRKIIEESRLNRVANWEAQKRQNQKNAFIQKTKEYSIDIEEYNLKKNTELTKRIEEIKALQKKSDYESARMINDLLKQEFKYKYPFFYNVNKVRQPHNISDLENAVYQEDFIQNDNLINHIIREHKLNNTIDTFNDYMDLIDSYNMADNKLTFLAGLVAFSPIIIIFIILSSEGSWLLGIFLSLTVGALICTILVYVFRYFIDKKIDKYRIRVSDLFFKLKTIKSKIN